MTGADDILTALAMPADTRLDQRIAKKLLLENGAPTAADRRGINEGIEELIWVAALKPTNVGVPAYRDETREYLEIAVLRLSLRPTARRPRLTELVHRAVPYPVVLVAQQGAETEVSAVAKRWSQTEAGKTVLDGALVTVCWDVERDSNHWPSFHHALALGNQPRTTLHALYQGWIDTLLALHAARVTGTFLVAVDAEHAAVRRAALQECAWLNAEIARLRSAASKEKQMARRIELNLELKRVEAGTAAARAKL